MTFISNENWENLNCWRCLFKVLGLNFRKPNVASHLRGSITQTSNQTPHVAQTGQFIFSSWISSSSNRRYFVASFCRIRFSQWRRNERDSISNHRRLDCLLNRLFGRKSKKTPKLRVTGLREGNPHIHVCVGVCLLVRASVCVSNMLILQNILIMMIIVFTFRNNDDYNYVIFF